MAWRDQIRLLDRKGSKLQGEALLNHLAYLAARYGLTVWQWKGKGEVGQHSANSLHFQTYVDGIGRAFDAYGPSMRMRSYAWHLRIVYGRRLSEGIHNCGVPGGNLSVKNGENVPASFWGATTWDNHTNHVHVGI
jgi:hypothetical protein